MKDKYILASVGDVTLLRPDGEVILTSKTLTESGISFTTTEQEVRGGMLNGLIASFFTDSAMTLTLTDATFNMQSLAVNVGADVQMSADVMTIETITTTQADKVTVSKEPKMFGNVGTIGWVSLAGQDEWTKVVFDPLTKTANVPDLPIGTTVCVKYVKEDASAEQITVSSAFIPSQCYALLTLPLFKCGNSSTGVATSSAKIGEVQVEIPTFQLSGAVDLSLTASGNATTPLSGKALMTFGGGADCSTDSGYYARLKQVIMGKDEFADVKSIVIADSDIELETSEKQILQVYAIYGGVTAPRLIDNSKITFTMEAGKTSVATVDIKGEIEAKGVGQAYVEAVITGHTNLIAKAVVEVTA